MRREEELEALQVADRVTNPSVEVAAAHPLGAWSHSYLVALSIITVCGARGVSAMPSAEQFIIVARLP
jgi:hypothetical protein